MYASAKFFDDLHKILASMMVSSINVSQQFTCDFLLLSLKGLYFDILTQYGSTFYVKPCLRKEIVSV